MWYVNTDVSQKKKSGLYILQVLNNLTVKWLAYFSKFLELCRKVSPVMFLIKSALARCRVVKNSSECALCSTLTAVYTRKSFHMDGLCLCKAVWLSSVRLAKHTSISLTTPSFPANPSTLNSYIFIHGTCNIFMFTVKLLCKFFS